MIVGVAQRPKVGEKVCGDHHLLLDRSWGLLVMVCDGTGHGSEAAEASQLAAASVQACADEPLEAILASCGRALRGSRGAAVALLRLDVERQKIEFASVGNVELRSDARARVAPVCSPGVVGRPVRKILTFSYPLHSGDRFALFTDGISRRLDLASLRRLPVQSAADRILEDHGVTHDDATCVIVEHRQHEQ